MIRLSQCAALHLMIKQSRNREAGHATYMGKQQIHTTLRSHMRWEDNEVYPEDNSP
jgi:hypothetical protein